MITAIYYFMDEEVEGRLPCWVLNVTGGVPRSGFEFTMESAAPIDPESFRAEWQASPNVFVKQIEDAISSLLSISPEFSLSFSVKSDVAQPRVEACQGGAE